jgi:hypothetical protein
MDSTNWGNGIVSSRTFGGYHSIHLSYGRDPLILQEFPAPGRPSRKGAWGENWVKA